MICDESEFPFDYFKLEEIFQNEIERFLTYTIPDNYTREPEIAGGTADFEIFRYILEVKIRKNSLLSQQKFVEKHLGQIKGYCSAKDKKIGFLVYYDDGDDEGEMDFVIKNNMYFYNVKYNQSLAADDPLIFIVRIPRYLKNPSDF